MDKAEAKAILKEMIPQDKWGAFTDWMEELGETGDCSHDGEAYGEWLQENGLAGSGDKIYDAMSVYSGFGPCPCAAGQDILESPHA